LIGLAEQTLDDKKLCGRLHCAPTGAENPYCVVIIFIHQHGLDYVGIAAFGDGREHIASQGLATVGYTSFFQYWSCARDDAGQIEQDAFELRMPRQYFGEQRTLSATHIHNTCRVGKIIGVNHGMGRHVR
jgi:hypothetical protein